MAKAVQLTINGPRGPQLAHELSGLVVPAVNGEVKSELWLDNRLLTGVNSRYSEEYVDGVPTTTFLTLLFGPERN